MSELEDSSGTVRSDETHEGWLAMKSAYAEYMRASEVFENRRELTPDSADCGRFELTLLDCRGAAFERYLEARLEYLEHRFDEGYQREVALVSQPTRETGGFRTIFQPAGPKWLMSVLAVGILSVTAFSLVREQKHVRDVDSIRDQLRASSSDTREKLQLLAKKLDAKSVIGLVGLPLNLISLLVCASAGRQLTTYWKYGVRYSSGLTALEEITVFVSFSLALVVFCWTGGFVLAAISRQAIWATGFFYLLLCSWPLLLAVTFPLWGLRNHEHASRVEIPLASLILTIHISLQALLVALPTLLGIRRGNRKRMLSVQQTRALAVVSAVLAGGAIWMSGWQAAGVARWSGGVWVPSIGWEGRLLPFIFLCWPVGYLLATADAARERKDQRA